VLKVAATAASDGGRALLPSAQRLQTAISTAADGPTRKPLVDSAAGRFVSGVSSGGGVAFQPRDFPTAATSTAAAAAANSAAPAASAANTIFCLPDGAEIAVQPGTGSTGALRWYVPDAHGGSDRIRGEGLCPVSPAAAAMHAVLAALEAAVERVVSAVWLSSGQTAEDGAAAAVARENEALRSAFSSGPVAAPLRTLVTAVGAINAAATMQCLALEAGSSKVRARATAAQAKVAETRRAAAASSSSVLASAPTCGSAPTPSFIPGSASGAGLDNVMRSGTDAGDDAVVNVDSATDVPMVSADITVEMRLLIARHLPTLARLIDADPYAVTSGKPLHFLNVHKGGAGQ